MNKNEYINSNVLSNRQREFKSELWDEYNAARRKSNIFGGIISAVATIYINSKYLGCDYSGTLSDSDKIKTAAVFIGLLFLWRMIRQIFMQKTFDSGELPYDDEVKAAVERMSPQNAMKYLEEEKEHKDNCKSAKTSGNAAAFILMAAVVGVYYAVQKGMI